MNPCFLSFCGVQKSFEPDLHTWTSHHAMKLERVLCTNWLARARRKGHALSHAIQRRQHSIQSDVDLYVVLECLKNFRYFMIEVSKCT